MTDSLESNAWKVFQIENSIKVCEFHIDNLLIDSQDYRFHDTALDVGFEDVYERKPWKEDPQYFKRVWI